MTIQVCFFRRVRVVSYSTSLCVALFCLSFFFYIGTLVRDEHPEVLGQAAVRPLSLRPSRSLRQVSHLVV